MGCRAKFQININALLTVARDLGNGSYPIDVPRGCTLTDGTGDNQCDGMFDDQRSLADGLDETLDLGDGSLEDGLGQVVTLAALKILYIKNNSSDASLLVGGAAANAIGLFSDPSDVAVILPGGERYISAPLSGVDISSDAHLKLAHNGDGTSALVYDIIAVGVNA